MKPFDDYPGEGTTILKRMGRANARTEDGLWLMKNTCQYRCAYCEVSLVDSYYHWLLLNVDHVIPASQCERLGIPKEWHHSFTNTVLACFGCNLFDNRYSVEWEEPKVADEWTVSEFVSLRDKVFKERKERILKRRSEEIDFYRQHIEGYSRLASTS